MDELVPSRYLRIFPRPDGHAVYHGLFGGLAVLDDGALALLRGGPAAMRRAATGTPRARQRCHQLASEFQARGFLVPDGFDERAVIEEGAAARIERCRTGHLVRALQLVVANECNFRCKYCFAKTMWRSPERTELQSSPSNQVMSAAVAHRAMDELLALVRGQGHDTLQVEFFGGEPLTNWPVIASVLECYGNGRAGDVAIRYSTTTNGSLLTREMADVLQRYGVTVTMSFDSPASTDRVLAHAERRTARELLEDKLDLLRAAGNWVTFNSVLSKETVERFDGAALVDYALERGVRMIGLILDLDPEFYAQEELKRLAARHVLATHQYGSERGMPVVGYWHQTFAQIAGWQPSTLRSGYKTCPAEGCKLSVEPDGHLFICKCCGTLLGHISRLREALATEAYQAYAQKGFQNAPACTGCELEGFCSGLCVGAVEKQRGRLGVIEPTACDLFREINRGLVLQAPPGRLDRLAVSEEGDARQVVAP